MTHFENAGPQNTKETIDLAVKTAKDWGIKDIVVATVTGASMADFPDDKDLNVVCVTHACGFKEPGELEMSGETINTLTSRGFKVYTASHTFGAADRGVSYKLGGVTPPEMIAHTLRFFGQGMKVAVEAAVMAADGALIPPGVPVVSLGGTKTGLDTAIIVRAAHSRDILDTKINEVICMPIEK